MEHDWETRQLHKPTFCELCTAFIRTVTAQRCKVCRTTVHSACHLINCIAPETGVEHTMIEKTFLKSTWCNVCRRCIKGVIRKGSKCTLCNIVTHEKCKTGLGSNCRPVSVPLPPPPDHWVPSDEDPGRLQHHWIEGNVKYPKTDSMQNFCIVCQEPLSNPVCLTGFQCAWCTRLCHSACMWQSDSPADGQPSYCDGGIIAPLKVSPQAVSPEGELLPERLEWSPLVCFVNSRSGGGQGASILHKLQHCLHPIQVFDLAKGGPEPGLNRFRNCPNGFAVLVCGGDGTVSWVLDTLRRLDWPVEQRPPIAILPLGTGNDMSRVLGWGGGYKGEPIRGILEQILLAPQVQLDRWRLVIDDLTTNENHEKVFNNYFSIGIDAHILNNFHEKREASPHLFKSRSVNKAWYGLYSAKALNKKVLNQVELFINGKLVELDPGIEGILIVNVPSYAAGTDIWKQDPPQSFSDGIIEVVGIKGVTHMATVVSGPGTTICLGRGETVELRLAAENSVQIDGEPWTQGPSVLRFDCLGQVAMLKNVPTEEDSE